MRHKSACSFPIICCWINLSQHSALQPFLYKPARPLIPTATRTMIVLHIVLALISCRELHFTCLRNWCRKSHMIITLISGLQYLPHNTSWFNKCMSLKCKGCSCLNLHIMLRGFVTADIEIQSQTWFSIRVKIWVFWANYVIIAQQQKCIVLKMKCSLFSII